METTTLTRTALPPMTSLPLLPTHPTRPPTNCPHLAAWCQANLESAVERLEGAMRADHGLADGVLAKVRSRSSLRDTAELTCSLEGTGKPTSLVLDLPDDPASTGSLPRMRRLFLPVSRRTESRPRALEEGESPARYVSLSIFQKPRKVRRRAGTVETAS